MNHPLFKKAVIWGCDLHEHTNSYVYAGFYKAFKAMGYDSYWLNEHSDVSGMNFSDTIFITEWQHAKNIPKRKDCKYVLHNCNPVDYEGLHFIHLQTYRDICRDNTCEHNHIGKPTKLNDQGSWYLDDPRERTIFQPWATDLLPHEFNFDDADFKRLNHIFYCGSVNGGEYSNLEEVEHFKEAVAENHMRFHHLIPGATSFESNRYLIRDSYLAPSIHGAWQAKAGYIACRVFKNISYGQLGGTNCWAAAELLDGNIIYNSDTKQLFYDMKSKINDRAMIKRSMQLIKEKHTYINRIESILSVL